MIIDYEVRDLKEGIDLAKNDTGNDVYANIRFVNLRTKNRAVSHFTFFTFHTFHTLHFH